MAHDLIKRVEARRMSEIEGVSICEIGRRINVSHKTIRNWKREEGWMTASQIRKMIKSGNNMVCPPSPQQTQEKPGVGTQPEQMQESCNNEVRHIVTPEGLVRQPVTPTNGQVGHNVTPINDYQNNTLGKKQEDYKPEQANGAGMGNPEPQVTQKTPVFPQVFDDSHTKTGDFPTNAQETPAGVSKVVDFGPNDPAAVGHGGSRVRPAGAPWPLVGNFDRAATIAEMLPQDYTGFEQTIRDADCLARAEAVRSVGFRENMSATLLKLSQYALSLADSDPRTAMLVMGQIQKLYGIGEKQFKLDDSGGESKAGEQLRKVSGKEEDGDGVVVIVD